MKNYLPESFPRDPRTYGSRVPEENVHNKVFFQAGTNGLCAEAEHGVKMELSVLCHVN